MISWFYVKGIILSFLSPINNLSSFLFFFVPPILQLLSINILVLNIGKWLHEFDKKKAKVILYVFFLVYTTFYLFVNYVDISLDASDVFLIIINLFAPISMLIIGRKIFGAQVRGRDIFTSYILLLIYGILCIVWELLYPEQIDFPYVIVYIGIFVIINIVLLKVNKSS